jgi:CrcB protein
MKNLILIFLGGGIGSITRFLLSSFSKKIFKFGAFPVGTLSVNFLGCLIIGFLLPALVKSDSYLKFLLITGFCGGFTTFSAFSLENFGLWQDQQYGLFALNIVASVVLGLVAVFCGVKLYEIIK